MNKDQFIDELAKLRSASTFLTLKGYRNVADEVADYSVAFHMSYHNALEKSIAVLQGLSLKTPLEQMARDELIDSFRKSLSKMESTPLEEIDDGYTRFFDDDGKHIKGVKMHNATGALHMYGLVVHKRVTLPGVYPTVNSRPLTIAKDKLRYLTPVGKFRQFKILPTQVERIAVENISLLPPV